MAFSIHCDACGKSFSIPDDIYERRVAGRVVTIKCKQCKADIRVDGRGPTPVVRLADASEKSDALSASEPDASRAPPIPEKPQGTAPAPATAAPAAKPVETATPKPDLAQATANAGGPAAPAKPAGPAAQPGPKGAETATPQPAANAAKPVGSTAKAAAAPATRPTTGATAPVAPAKAAATPAAKPAETPTAKPAGVPKAAPSPTKPAAQKALTGKSDGAKSEAAKPSVDLGTAKVAPENANAAAGNSASKTEPAKPAGGRPPPPRGPLGSAPNLKAGGQPVGSLSPRLSRAVGKPEPTPPKPSTPDAEPSIEELWAVDFGNEDRELTLPALVESIRRGEVQRDTLVWRVGMPGWQAAAEIPELGPHFAETPAKPGDENPFDFESTNKVRTAAEKEKEIVAVSSSSALDADVVTSAPTPAAGPARPAPAAVAPAAPAAPVAPAAPTAPATVAAAPAAPRAPATPPALPAQQPTPAAPRVVIPPPLPGGSPTAGTVEQPAPALAPMGVPRHAAAVPGPILSDVSALLRAQQARKKLAMLIAGGIGVVLVITLVVLMASSGGTSEAPAIDSASGETTATAISTRPKSTAAPTTGQTAPAPQTKSFSEMFAAAASANSGATAAFDAEDARRVVEGAATQLSNCRGSGALPGSVSVEVSFAPRGIAISAKVGPPYGGTAPGACMESALKSLRVKPFSGGAGTIKSSLHLQ